MRMSKGRRALFTKKMEHREKLMSNKYNDLFKENVTFCLDEIWTLNDREDLFDDCVAYVMDELSGGVVDGRVGHSHILVATINYFQSISGNAVSNDDLEQMATDEMTLLTKENLLSLEKIFKMFDTIDLESQWQSESLKDYQANQKDSLYEKYLYIEEETFIDIKQKLEIITNNLIKTRTMLEEQPWINDELLGELINQYNDKQNEPVLLENIELTE